MKITAIQHWKDAVPLARPYTIATRRIDSVELFFVRLEAGGETGWGSASPAEDVTGESAAACDDALGALVPSDLPELDSEKTARTAAVLAPRLAPTPAARAAVDMALWDLAGKTTGRPVVELLGRCHEALPTSVTLGISSVDETLSDAADYVGRGFRHLKVKLGLDLEVDLERLEKLRQRFGKSIALRVDANQGYDRAQTAALLAAATGLGLELVEQPVPVGRDQELVGLEAGVPLAVDESLLGVDDAPRWASAESPYSIFNLKLMKCGGITPALEMAAIGKSSGRTLMWGCMDESALSIAAALHSAYAAANTRFLDLDGSLDLVRDPARGGFEFRDGRMFLTDRPGLGTEVEQ